MRIVNNLNWSNAKRLIAWLKRPRVAVLRLRELLHARQSGPVRSNIDLSNLPEIELRRAVTATDLASVVSLYNRNPSHLIIAPCDQQTLEQMLSKKVVFYQVLDDKGTHVGNLGYQSARRMFSYLQIDYPYRSRGYALAAELAGEQAIALQGIDHVYAQVFRINRRGLSTFLSLGWEIDNAKSTGEYFVLEKTLSTPSTDEESNQR